MSSVEARAPSVSPHLLPRPRRAFDPAFDPALAGAPRERPGDQPGEQPGPPRSHPRVVGWLGTTALALGGSNQSLFLLTALMATQGSAAIPLLAVGLVLSWMAAPGWTELVLMYPDRVGGIAASCSEAFRPYSPVLANLTGACYWWGWVPTCGLTALLSASALHAWYLHWIPVPLLACVIVVAFTALNLAGVARVTRVVTVLAAGSATLAFLSAAVPVLTGHVDYAQATTFNLTAPFGGIFGKVTSAMAGLYLIGFAAPAFEAATCHVGETRDPARAVPRAVFASAGMATVYFVALPVVWLGVFGSAGLQGDLARDLGPTFAPLLGAAGKSAAVWFMVLNMFHGTVQPLAGAARTLSQCAEDGLLPRLVERRNRFDAPWVATLLTAALAIAFLLAGDPVWMIAAANFTYLIGIALPSIAVWLLRRNAPLMERPWRAWPGTIVAGVVAAGVWLLSTLLGFSQFSLRTVMFGLALAYSGSVFYAWRRWSDRRRAGTDRLRRSLHLKLTGAMLAVMALDGAGYLLAIGSVDHRNLELVTVLEDIFVAVAVLTVSVGLVLPGMIAHAATEVATAARRLAEGTLGDLTRAMHALGAGDLDAARARVVGDHVVVQSRDEVGAMADAFNTMQDEVARAALSLDEARDQLRRSRDHLEHLAGHDSLTGLPNRRLFAQELQRVVACPGALGAVLVIDLDGFKYVNDSRGHAVGDEVLVRTSALLRSGLRPQDILGRLGGDEFAAVLPGVGGDQAVTIVERILDQVRAEAVVVDMGRAVRVTVSVGMALYQPGKVCTAGGLLADADVAMYDAKEAGRDRLSLASTADPHQMELRERHSWLERIGEALEHDRFTLYAQPILDLSTNTVTRAELLLRMVEEDGTVVLPGAFLPAAERSGVVSRIDRWVIRRACELIAAAQRAGREVCYEVNLSGQSVGDPAMLELLEHELAGLPHPGGLVIEVTETAAVVNIERARAFAERLESLGCQFALDDFGAGYGSFFYLKHLPFDFLKIDGDFVRGLADSHADQAVVRALVDIAKALGKRTIAEFVEDDRTLQLLRGLGVDFAQGYHVGRPEPLADAPSVLGVAAVG